MALAARDDLRAAPQGVGDMLLDLLDRVGIDQGTGGGAVLQAVAHGQLVHGAGEALRELVINARLHVDAVGADAGLAVVAELGGHGAFHRRIQVRVVEDDEGRVSAQFHRAFQHLVGGLAQKDAAHLGRTGEGQLADQGVLAELLADVGGPRRGHDRQDALGQARAFPQHGQRQRRQGRFRGRTGDEAAAHRQRRAAFAGDHGIGEVPGRDRGHDPDRLAQHGDALVGHVAGDRLAIDALGFLAEPFDEAGAIGDLALALGQGLALLGGQDGAQVVLVFHHQLEPAAHDLGAVLGGARGPVLHGGLRGLDGALDLGAAQVRHAGDHVAPGGVPDLEGRAVVGIHPLARDKGAGFQQRGVLEQHLQVGGMGGHGVLRSVARLLRVAQRSAPAGADVQRLSERDRERPSSGADEPGRAARHCAPTTGPGPNHDGECPCASCLRPPPSPP